MHATNKDYFRTTQFQLATFLCAVGFSVRGINPITYTQSEFLFDYSEELISLVNKYKFGDENEPLTRVNVIKYEQERSRLLDLVKS